LVEKNQLLSRDTEPSEIPVAEPKIHPQKLEKIKTKQHRYLERSNRPQSTPYHAVATRNRASNQILGHSLGEISTDRHEATDGIDSKRAESDRRRGAREGRELTRSSESCSVISASFVF
jgi:hypothetical protein